MARGLSSETITYYNDGGYVEMVGIDLTRPVESEFRGIALVACAIAMGLNQEQSDRFCKKAYAAVKGLDNHRKYEQLVKLAYEIKVADE